MASQKNLDIAYMKCAIAISELSYANRKKVGAILVSKDGGIIAEGVNGTPSGFNNNCEHDFHDWKETKETWVCSKCHIIAEDNKGTCPILTTKPEVLHAESNAILKVARSTNSSQGTTLYITTSPCFECAKLIIQAGIWRVVYLEKYRILDGLKLLTRANIKHENISII